MKPYDCVVLYHNYYSLTGIDEVRAKLGKLTDQKLALLTSLPEKLFLQKKVRNNADEKFLITTNKGKDIGGKLQLIDLVIQLYADVPYLIFLHDKRSYQKLSGNHEKEKLFQIIDHEKYYKAINFLNNDRMVGIVCEQSCIKSEYNSKSGDFNTTNDHLLKQLVKQYQLETNDYRFVAGTMFMVRTSIYTDFFKRHNPNEIRSTLESGNILDSDQGTVTHSWERLLSWIATSAGYKIKGI